MRWGAGLDKGGIVKDDRLRQQKSVDGISNWIQAQGWHLFGIADSPITGPDGNHEYLIAAENDKIFYETDNVPSPH